MNKFSSTEDPNFKLVRDSIKNLVQEAANVLKRRKTGEAKLFSLCQHLEIALQAIS